MDISSQLALFSKAVDAIGGLGKSAAALDMNERNLRRILQGKRRLLVTHLDAISKALLAHAEACRQLERQLSPLYTANLTQAQAKPPLHDGRGPQRKRLPEEQIAEMAQRLGLRSPPQDPLTLSLSKGASAAGEE